MRERSILQRSVDLNSKNFLFGVHYGATLCSHYTKQTVKKLNLLGQMPVDKSAFIKL